jgi:hypothetical protein
VLVLFLKAKLKGFDAPDLFATTVHVSGHTQGGVYVEPYEAIRHVRHEVAVVPPSNPPRRPEPEPHPPAPATDPYDGFAAGVYGSAALSHGDLGRLVLTVSGALTAAQQAKLTAADFRHQGDAIWWQRARNRKERTPEELGEIRAALEALARKPRAPKVAHKDPEREPDRIAAGQHGPVRLEHAGKGYRVLFKYDPKLVEAIRAVPGRKWDADSKHWFVPFGQEDKLRGIMGQAGEVDAANRAARAEQEKEWAAQKEAQRQEWAREKEEQRLRWAEEKAQKARERAERGEGRTLYPLSRMPATGVPTRIRGAVVVYTGTGDKFRINEDHPSMHGSHLLGHEGEYGAYAYYRQASPEETDALEAREAVETEARERARVARVRLNEIRADVQRRGDVPIGGAMPQGDLLAEGDRRLNIYGGGWRLIAAPDGIWLIQGNGADGDDWSRNNLPGSIGWRVPRDPALEAELRDIAAKMA